MAAGTFTAADVKVLSCEENLLGRDLGGTVAVVTGANSGIGLVTAAQLAGQGATVLCGARTRAKAETACREARDAFRGGAAQVRGDLQPLELELGDLASVRAAADDVARRFPGGIHLLVNNAGVMMCPLGRTKDGFETQLGVNHLGHFELTNRLLPLLKKAAPSRVVIVSSCAHVSMDGFEGAVDYEDPNYEEREYTSGEAYCQSKLANVLHAQALARRLDGTGVTAVSLHPGVIITRLGRHILPSFMFYLGPILRFMMKMGFGAISAWQGAQTTLHCCLDPEVPSHSGGYYAQGSYPPYLTEGAWPADPASMNAATRDAAQSEKLWALSERLVDGAGER